MPTPKTAAPSLEADLARNCLEVEDLQRTVRDYKARIKALSSTILTQRVRIQFLEQHAKQCDAAHW
jgi:chromosome segregation ATPase